MELFAVIPNVIVYVTMFASLIFAIWWLISLYRIHTREAESKLPRIDLPADLKEIETGIPLSLVLFFAFIGVSMVSYILYAWLGGVTY